MNVKPSNFRACVQESWHVWSHSHSNDILCVWMVARAKCCECPFIRQLLLLSCSAFSFGEVKGCDVNCRQFAAEMCWPHAATHSPPQQRHNYSERERGPHSTRSLPSAHYFTMFVHFSLYIERGPDNKGCVG